MNIYEKLQTCRVELQGMNLKKSGHNKFSDFTYYELGDFLPQINVLFLECKLFGFVSFTSETATLKIINTEKPDETIEITSPMAEAKLKACHEIQNLGAVESYQRRYLYMTALEIVEHDIIDEGTLSPEKVAIPASTPSPAQAVSGPPAQDFSLISLPQQKRMFALSGGKDEIVRQALKEHGYEKSGEVKKAVYEAVCAKIQELAATPKEPGEDAEETVPVPF